MKPCALRCLLVFFVSLQVWGPASAAVITQIQAFSISGLPEAGLIATNEEDNGSVTVTITDTSVQSGSGPTLTFAQFDNANGPLTGVSISFEAQIAGALSIALNNNAGSLLTINADGTVTVNIGLPYTLGSLSASAAGTASCDAGSNGCSAQSNLAGVAANSFVATNLTPFIGNGTFDIGTSLDALLAISPDNSSSYFDNATAEGFLDDVLASGSVSVEYTFNAVPEPGVVLLLLAGAVAGFLQLRRRRG